MLSSLSRRGSLGTVNVVHLPKVSQQVSASINPDPLLLTTAVAVVEEIILYSFFLNRVTREFQETEVHKVNRENQDFQARREL